MAKDGKRLKAGPVRGPGEERMLRQVSHLGWKESSDTPGENKQVLLLMCSHLRGWPQGRAGCPVSGYSGCGGVASAGALPPGSPHCSVWKSSPPHRLL